MRIFGISLEINFTQTEVMKVWDTQFLSDEHFLEYVLKLILLSPLTEFMKAWDTKFLFDENFLE